MKRKPIYWFGLAVVLLAGMACSLAGGSPTEESVVVEEATPVVEGSVETGDESVISSGGMPVAGEGVCANAYYPVREGATWTYLDTSSVTEPFTQTDVISAVREDGYTLKSQIGEVTRTQEWACKPEGLVAMQLGGGLSVSGTNLVIDTQNASGVTYPVEIKAGDTWQHTLEFTGTMDLSGQTGEATGSTQSDFTALGMESVSIPAGTFDAMKVQVETTLDYTVTFQGMTVPVVFTSSTTSWYVQGVGWVRSESSGDFSGQTFTEKIELQSYSIP